MGVTVQRIERPEDAAYCMPLLREFFKDTRQAAYTALNEQAVEALLQSLIEDVTRGAVFAAIEDRQLVGVTGAMLYPLWFSPEHLTGQEMFWYVRKERRKSKAGKKLFQALEDWAREQGASSFSMMSLSHLDEKRVGQMYASKGYVPSERTYIKEFTQE